MVVLVVEKINCLKVKVGDLEYNFLYERNPDFARFQISLKKFLNHFLLR
jgi:hypothetical protein